MNVDKTDQIESWIENIHKKFTPDKKALLLFSVIIPTFNCSEKIGVTLNSLQRQGYSNLEVIIVDAGSSDKTLDIVHSYDLVSRIYMVNEYNVCDMMNRGILLSSGSYLTFLLPGCSYISPLTYYIFEETIKKQSQCDFFYCGSLQQDETTTQEIFRRIERSHLEKGRQPAHISACFFRSELFSECGKFNKKYLFRGALDFFMRLINAKNIKWHALDWVLVDCDRNILSARNKIRYASETWRTIVSNYGLIKACLWFLTIDYVQLMKLWLRSLRQKQE